MQYENNESPGFGSISNIAAAFVDLNWVTQYLLTPERILSSNNMVRVGNEWEI